MYKVFVVKNIEPLDNEKVDLLLKAVCSQKAQRIKRHRIKQGADNMLIGEVLAKYMIKEYFGIPIRKQSFVLDEYSKPYLKDCSDVFFNISHSGIYVVCAVSDVPVGVDVQKIVQYDERVAKRVFIKEQIEKIENSRDKAIAFTYEWTVTEAFGKMIGRGLSFDRSLLKTDIAEIFTSRFDDTVISVAIKKSDEQKNRKI